MKRLKNEKGQGLVEYLIIVALMGVATIGLVRVLNQNVNAQFANVICGIQGGSCRKAQAERVQESQTKKKDLSNFLNGARGREN